jgi:hypothetical protein
MQKYKDILANKISLYMENCAISRSSLPPKPTICLAIICKNEEHCIIRALESVYKYINYWIICDTGSTDNTVSLIQNFFKEKQINGEIFFDEWVGFSENKTLLFERCYKKTDLIINFDSDDFLTDDFTLSKKLLNYDNFIGFYSNIKRGDYIYKNYLLYNNNYKWKFVGEVHHLMICVDNYNNKEIDYHTFCDDEKYYLVSTCDGSRDNDPLKSLKDAQKLEKQFFDTLVDDEYNLNKRSAIYAGQSYYDYGDYKKALKWYSLYTKLQNIWIEEEYESYLRISKCMIDLEYNINDILKNISKCIDIFGDRADHHDLIGNYYLKYEMYNLAYFCFKKASEKNLGNVLKKYKLSVNMNSYGIHVLNKLEYVKTKINK